MDLESAKSTSANENESLFENNKASVVNILGTYAYEGRTVMKSAGSGFFLKDSSSADNNACEIVSDNHVVTPDSTLTLSSLDITFDDGSHHSGRISKIDQANDLAYIQITDLKNSDGACKLLAFAEHAPLAGEPLIRINRSLSGAEFTEGNFAEMRSREGMGLPDLENENKQRDLMVLKMHHSLGHQFSGSPYLNQEGKVVGIHEAGIENEQSIATPISTLEGQPGRVGK